MTSITSFSLVILGLGACLSQGVIAAQGQEQHPTVVLDTSKGPITLELYPDKAPITVANFLKYVDDGFYDNLIFHRVIPKFMIQGGGMTDQMQEKQKGKRPPIKNESNNGLSNKRGTIAMARMNDPNSASCQFFINHRDNPDLDFPTRGGYTVFGKVIEGMDVVDAIAEVGTTNRAQYGNVPVTPIYIKSAKRKDK
jgi:peptidyl-prolyl cis-trans isomerase A (cyclophilin A)